MKHLSVCILVAAAAACAGHPEQPAPVVRQPVAASALGGAPVAVAMTSPAAAATGKGPVTRQVPVDASNVAEVQRAGYKVVNKDGQKLYCRTDPITGSRLEKRTQCLTEQELYDQIRDTQRAMNHMTEQQTQSFSGK
jgi:hypothetical protein